LSAGEHLSKCGQRDAYARVRANPCKSYADRDFLSQIAGRLSYGGIGTPDAVAGAMSHRNVEMLIGRLATDPRLRRRFEDGPTTLLHELIAQGYELSPTEIDALAAIDADAIRMLTGTLDPRLRKVDHENDAKHSHLRRQP
jgi:hypothetical protein